jgi:hypothetical protein
MNRLLAVSEQTQDPEDAHHGGYRGKDDRRTLARNA